MHNARIPLGEASRAGRGSDERQGDRRKTLLAIALFFIALIAACLIIVLAVSSARSDGSRIGSTGMMNKLEAQSALDAEAARSRITVSLAPVLEWSPNRESLRVNFIVAPDNNGYSERFEIRQDGAVVYESEVVEPDHKVEQVRVKEVHEGPAVVTVYAVDGEGVDQGNPVSVESEIVEA